MVVNIINYITLGCSGITISTIFYSIIYYFKEKKNIKYSMINKNKYSIKLHNKKESAYLSYFVLPINYFNKICDSQKCNKYLPLNSEWYCFNGNIYCSTGCRLDGCYTSLNNENDNI
jgi:hypothetical protein